MAKEYLVRCRTGRGRGVVLSATEVGRDGRRRRLLSVAHDHRGAILVDHPLPHRLPRERSPQRRGRAARERTERMSITCPLELTDYVRR